MDKILQEFLEDLFEESIEKISSAENFHDLDAWDSLLYVNLVMGLQKKLSISLSKEEIAKLTSLNGILNVLKEKNI
jgi:acyl carrier protein